MAKAATKKTSKRQKESLHQGRHSQLGKAIVEALEDIKKGDVKVIRKDSLKQDLRKLME